MMSEKDLNWKEYPEQIKIGKLIVKKSPKELFLKLRPSLGTDMVGFLDEYRELIKWEFKPTDERERAQKKFNTFSLLSKWVTRADGTEETVDQLVQKFKTDHRVDFSCPVYFREDLRYPNGFAFEDLMIVTFDEKTDPIKLETLFQELKLEKIRKLGRRMMLLRVLDPSKRVYEVVKELNDKPSIIKHASVDWIQLHDSLCFTPNAQYFSKQWNLCNTGQLMPDWQPNSPQRHGTPNCDIKAKDAWDISTGSPLVVIAIIDSGCDMKHPDLKSQYVQSSRWYDAVSGSQGTFPEDKDGHGTVVAGIASDLTHFSSCPGIAGVGLRCRILPVRIYGDILDFATRAIKLHRIIDALQYCVFVDQHVDVINMSFTYDLNEEDPRDELNASLADCFQAGIVMFAAAGNRADSHPGISFPANNQNVIAVGATNENDGRCTHPLDWDRLVSDCGGSQCGNELSVVAPGVHIWGTDLTGKNPPPLPTNYKAGWNEYFDFLDTDGLRNGVCGDPNGDYYNDFFGTSAATPHAAGLAGLMLAYDPGLAPAEIKTIIEDTAEKVGNAGENVYDPAKRFWNKFMGHGRINAFAALDFVKSKCEEEPAEVYIRDSLGDDGTEPYTGSPLCYSPDIIVRQSEENDPQTAFGDKTVDPGSDKITIGQKNYIYVRVHNKGTVKSDVHVRIYFADLSTACSPDTWQYLDQYDFYEIDTNKTAVSSSAIVWNVPNPGQGRHFCIIASIEGTRDPHPDPLTVTNSLQYMDFIRNHNNICYRNVVLEEVGAGQSFTVNFFMSSFKDDAEKFGLRIVRKGAGVKLDIKVKLPRHMLEDKHLEVENAVERKSESTGNFRVFWANGKTKTTIGGLKVMSSRNWSELEVKVPITAKPSKIYQFSVQQISKRKILGDFQVICKIDNLHKLGTLPSEGKSRGIRRTAKLEGDL